MVMIATFVTIGWKFVTTVWISVMIVATFASIAVIDKKKPPVRVVFFYQKIYFFLKTFAIVAPISAGV
jgi:hypothetical protein